MNAAKMIVPSLTPKTESIRYPPMTGRMTLGQEYHEYRLENSEVEMFRESFSYKRDILSEKMVVAFQ